MDKPSPIRQLLQREAFPAGGIISRGQALHLLDRQLKTLLETSESLHCQVGNLRDGVLILYCDSTAWATRLRYQVPQLLARMREKSEWRGVQRIEVRVSPASEKPPEKQTVKIGSGAQRSLLGCAESVTDEALGSALRRLAAHYKGEEN